MATGRLNVSPAACRLVLLALLALAGSVSAAQSSDDGIHFFENRVRPVFVEHCYGCHSAQAKKVRGGLKLDTREDFAKGGTDGPVIVAGQPEQSRLIRAVRHIDPDLRMPPPKDGGKKLSDTIIADLVTWVKMGAPYPETPGTRADGLARPWSFEPVRESPVPLVQSPSAPGNAIDAFLQAKRDVDAKVASDPAPAADRRTLLRRATFDLTGLPPTPEEIESFEADTSTDAFARVVDRLLASPHYGERWGRHWLDVVRYADTAGDTADYPVAWAWRYRDYVIAAFNADKPYDEFLREQIAGDILAARGPRERYAERVTATGYLAISRRFGFDSENYHHLTIQDTLDSIGQTVLGLSLSCARCHDHKFDPVTMQDYYALYGIFASSRYAFPGSEQKGKLRAMVPLVPPAEAQSKWREYDERVAALSDRIARQKQPVPSAVLRSLHDPDGDFEIQKDAAGGSYGVLVLPWLWEGKINATTAAQSPFKNLYPVGKFGANISGGDQDYWLAQTLYPRRTRDSARVLHVNLDFRVTPMVTNSPSEGAHRFWIGARTALPSADSPAVELLIDSTTMQARSGDRAVKLAEFKPREWQNLQLELDLERRVFSGRLGRPGNVTSFAEQPFTPDWSGTIDYVRWDSSARTKSSLATLELDNFGLQPQPIAVVSTQPPTLPTAPGQPDPAVISAELETLTGSDGDLEWQTDGTAPAKPWNPGPNSVVKVSVSAQSPFSNVYPVGKLGVYMPHRAEYDGFGLTLARPYTAARTETLHVSFDFRCGAQEAGGDGSWRYYVGHGGGGSTAVELQFNGTDFFTRLGASYDAVARVLPGQWHQVQLTLDLKEKTYAGRLITRTNRTEFQGTFATGWDGTIDYTYIDGRGHRPGMRPALDADNFAFRDTPPPPFDGPALVESDADRAARRARVSELRKRLTAASGEVAKLTRELTQLLIDGPGDMAYGVVEGTPHDARLQFRGEPDRPGDVVPRGFIAALGGGSLPPGTEGSGRLELARWSTRSDHPLTARVMVNRLWQYHFGRGLVATPNDFGTRGQPPSHPELLDYLAARFVQSGWSIKAMHRLIMASAVYQSSSVISGSVISKSVVSESVARASRSLAPRPPTDPLHTDLLNTDYSSFKRRRLSAEEIRDAILAVSGEWDRTPSRGHPFPSPVMTAYSQHGPFSAVYDHNQRSVYLMTQRLKRHPFLALFDGPDPNASTADRRLTTVPTQALYFLNSPFVHEKSEALARRLHAAGTDEAERVTLAWRRVLGRAPTATEWAEAEAFLADYRAELGATAAGSSAAVPANDHETAALAAYVRALFGSNEFLYVD